MTPTTTTKKEKSKEHQFVENLEDIPNLIEDESPMQPQTIEQSQPEYHENVNEQIKDNTNSSVLSGTTSKYIRKVNVGKVGGMSSYIDYKSNKDAKKLLNVILNDLDKKWDAKALMFKQVAKAQRSLRKKSEEDYKVLSQKYHRLISDYDLLKKTSEDDIQVLRLHIHEAEDRLAAHHASIQPLNDELNETKGKNAEYLDTIYHLDGKLNESDGQLAIARNHFESAQNDSSLLRIQMETLREQQRENEAIIASLKASKEVQGLIENFNPITAILVLTVAYLLACVLGLAADPIKIAMISTGV
ncbi:hypothetical protein E3Q17_02728 [Wallemia mellicola]|uniref:Uncharacterized protein n=1 Tax=Wallemia mellicola TaxID=1708541 RepID=A0A4V4MLE1_9BASI|nr:hypothetical protein E3Q17_02728 [Wallemia mellicola]